MSDFDDAPGEWETIECLAVGVAQLATDGWMVGCLIAFDDEIVRDFF